MKNASWHPLLLAVFVPLLTYSRHPNHYHVSDAAEAVGVLLAAAICLWMLFGWLMRDRGRGASAAGLTILILPAVGGIRSDIQENLPLSPEAAAWAPSVLTLVMILLAVALIARLKRGQLDALRRLLNTLAVCLITFAAIGCVSSLREGRRYLHDAPQLPHSSPPRKPAVPPDIWYIVLDSYGGSESLRSVFAFDNRWFLEGLQQRGFYVASAARAAYSQTLPAVAAALNFEYVQTMLPEIPPEYSREEPLLHLVRRNRLMRMLQGYGYRTTVAASGYYANEIRCVDQFVPALAWNPMLASFLRAWTVPPLTRWGDRQRAGAHYRTVVDTFARLPQMPVAEVPDLIFAHILAPHPPFVLDAQGRFQAPEGEFNLGDGVHYLGRDYVGGYREQAAFISRRTLELVDAIQAGVPNSVIIIMGDHGSGVRHNSTKLEVRSLRERFEVLSAVFFPDRDYGMLYPSINSINLMRAVLVKYFDAALPLVADRSYYATMDRPYSFTEVGSRIDELVAESDKR